MMRESELVERAKAGNHAAFEQLYLLHVDRVVRLVRSIHGPGADVEDLVQETFITVHRRLGKFRGDCAFYTWLHRITVNVCISALRGKKRRSRRDDAHRSQTDVESPQSPMEFDPEARRKLEPFYAALRELDPVKRIAFVLYHVEGYSLEEIGSLTEARVSTVSERIRTARQALQKIIKRQARIAARELNHG